MLLFVDLCYVFLGFVLFVHACNGDFLSSWFQFHLTSPSVFSSAASFLLPKRAQEDWEEAEGLLRHVVEAMLHTVACTDF